MSMEYHRPVVYAGESCSKNSVKLLAELGWGQCCTSGPTESQQLRFFMDNGAWQCFVSGAAFAGDQFLRRMEAAYERGQQPDFVVLPDVVGNAKETLNLSSHWHPLIPPAWPRYLALQDGIMPWHVVAFMASHSIEGLFIGGTAWFKNEKANFWCRWAHERGMKCHYARAGTPRKFEHAIAIRADSLDSARLSRNGERWNAFAACSNLWLKGPQPRLFAEDGITGTMEGAVPA